MKTYNEFSSDFTRINEPSNPENLEESILRTATSIALVSKVRSLYKQIKQTHKFNKNDNPEVQLEHLFSKIDLLSDQVIKLSYLIAQLSYMKEKK
jgi:hypothetical protein